MFRFAFIFIVLERLLKVHHTLRQMVVSNLWVQWSGSTESRSRRFETIVLSSTFWDEARSIVVGLQPLHTVLRLTDREGSTMGLLYEFMDRLGEQLDQCTELSFARYIL